MTADNTPAAIVVPTTVHHDSRRTGVSPDNSSQRNRGYYNARGIVIHLSITPNGLLLLGLLLLLLLLLLLVLGVNPRDRISIGVININTNIILCQPNASEPN
ncbi:MAG: hypothetical protein Q8L11_01805 [Candidatus Moranbacteria bacterium]|nr:hypothetical protein [Candidatus Moranbacteria bacterium]